jgi:hypothetical protein
MKTETSISLAHKLDAEVRAGIFEGCIARVHAALLHEKALQGKPLPDFSAQRWADRNNAKNKAQGEKYRMTMKAKGAVR